MAFVEKEAKKEGMWRGEDEEWSSRNLMNCYMSIIPVLITRAGSKAAVNSWRTVVTALKKSLISEQLNY